MSTEATFYTIANARFFPGLVALLNSLRLTGNEGELVVLDRGLSPAHRRALEGHVRLVEIPDPPEGSPALLKAYPHMLGETGTIVIVDSDMVVGRDLGDIVELAAAGKICAFPDPVPHRGRWFDEWHDALGLRASLRRGTYLNAGFLALSTEHHPDLLGRWWELCERIPREQHFGRAESPFWAGDQDVLNPLLRSEVPEDAVVELPGEQEAYPDELLETEIVDEATLNCQVDGTRLAILHYALSPKAWERKAPVRLRDDAYIRLLPRLFFEDDVAVRLSPSEVPFWLRPTTQARVFVGGLDKAHAGARGLAHALPAPVRSKVLELRNALYRRLT